MIQLLLWWAALGIALAGAGGCARRSTRSQTQDCASAYVLGAAATVALGSALGWLEGRPDPVSACVLALPLGPAWSARTAGRGFLDRTLGALPPALMVARAGCWIAGCCGGAEAGTAGASAGVGHPVPLYEIALLGALHGALFRSRRVRNSPGCRAGAFLVGFGAIRLGLDPLRADATAVGNPIAIGIAWGWVLAGAWLWLTAGPRQNPGRRLT